MKLRVLSLFAGIGGIDLGLERTGGFETAQFVERDDYCRAVLARHWPDVPQHADVRDFHAEEGRFDVIAGGFPCQPVSLAGARKAQADERWLWPEFARLVGEAGPPWVLVENVRGLCSKGLGDVLADLAGLGYDAEWQVVSAASVGAPHLRERVLVVAYPKALCERFQGAQERDGQPEAGGQVPFGEDADGLRDVVPDAERGELRLESRRGGGAHGQGAALSGLDGEAWSVADADDGGRLGRARDIAPALMWREPTHSRAGNAGSWATEPDVGRVAHGVPARMDRLRALGNAVVPQVAQFVGELILEAEAGATT